MTNTTMNMTNQGADTDTTATAPAPATPLEAARNLYQSCLLGLSFDGDAEEIEAEIEYLEEAIGELQEALEADEDEDEDEEE